MEPQDTPIQNTTERKKKSSGIAFIIVLLLLLAAIAYIYLDLSKKPTTVKEEATQEKVQTQAENNVVTDDTATQEDTFPQTSITTGKADIDEDLKSFDSLNLSGVENDYGSDTINDLK